MAPHNLTFDDDDEYSSSDDSDDDSDGGLVMAKSKKGPSLKDHQQVGKPVILAKRRDTQTSIGSTETAKKLEVQSE